MNVNVYNRELMVGSTRQYQALGVQAGLPVFYENLKERLTFPLSWLSGKYVDFPTWRKEAQRKFIDCLLSPPPFIPFEPEILQEQDRGSYNAFEIALNLTKDSRILALMLIPKGKGPFPAVLLLHDHGGNFLIGKEKVIRPLSQRSGLAEEWTKQCYGGRFIGDELARRGYLCFATDMLNWSDRGGGGFDGQQVLASNLFHLGSSFAGLIAYEDLQAARFLATHPQVDGARIAAMGLSVGSFRTWQVCALSDYVKAGVAVCWMATVKGLMTSGNNQTTGQSAFTMTHPGLFNWLDYPDLASIACPKPMLFYSGEYDDLFPIPSVREAYDKMKKVWKSQGVIDRLETKIWPVPHIFNVEMQEAAFRWLDHHLVS